MLVELIGCNGREVWEKCVDFTVLPQFAQMNGRAGENRWFVFRPCRYIFPSFSRMPRIRMGQAIVASQ